MDETQTNQEQQAEQVTQEPKKSNTLLIGGAVAAVILIAGFFLFSMRKTVPGEPQVIGESTNLDQSSENVGQTESSITSQPDENSQLKEITVEASSFYYDPKEIRIKLGDTVRINLTAKDLTHDFNVDELGVDGPVIKAGETTTIEFVADQTGEFEYYCSVGQHRANGQVGTLIVEE